MTNVMQTVETACLLIGAIIVLISLILSVFSFAGGNVMRGITRIADVLFGGLVIGLGPTWIGSLTAQASLAGQDHAEATGKTDRDQRGFE